MFGLLALLPACHLLVRCSDAALRRLAVRMPAGLMRTTTPRRLPTTLRPCHPFRTCRRKHPMGPAFHQWLKALLLLQTVLLQVLPRPTLQSRKSRLVQRLPRPTSLQLGRWMSMRTTTTSRMRRRRPVPRPRAAPTAVPLVPRMAMELPATAARVPRQRPTLRHKKPITLFLRPLSGHFRLLCSFDPPQSRDVRYECRLR